MKKWSGLILLMWLAVVCFLSLQQAVLAQEINEAGSSRDKDVFGSGIAAGYVARQENLRSFFGGVSSYLGKAIIVSKLAAGKQISGDFDFSTGDVVSKVSRQMGLIAYYDGNVIYIYDASETKNSVIKLQNVSPKALRLFLKKSGLADPRYPLRGDDVDTFYLSGPPIYVDLVTQAAQFIDSQDVHIDNQRVEIIKLHNTFVTDRAYTRRDENIVIPGIASIVEKLLNQNFSKEVQRARKDAASPDLLDTLVESKSSIVSGASQEKLEVSQSRFPVAGKINVIAYPETNSLLVKGTAEQVRFIRSLVESLDEEKRHIELALWIIDIQKDNLDQLGVNWQGAVSIGGGDFCRY